MPYNSETETFYQAPATVVDSTPDGDTVQEGFDDRLTPAMAGLYADLNLLKADGMISVGIPATTTSRGIGRVATLADMKPGAVVENGPAVIDAKGGVITPTPTANAVPKADSTGKIGIGWLPSIVINVRNVLTTSGTFTAPATGWFRIVAVGGGGSGGAGGYPSTGGVGGKRGGTTSFGSYVSAPGGSAGGGGGGYANYSGGGGGGGAGEVVVKLLYLHEGDKVSVVIGAGGVAVSAATSGECGGAGEGPTAGGACIGSSGGSGAAGASNGCTSASGGRSGNGGAGGRNGTGYGGGGGGGAASFNPTHGQTGGTAADGASAGSIPGSGKGGNGAVIIEYFDPSVTG